MFRSGRAAASWTRAGVCRTGVVLLAIAGLYACGPTADVTAAELAQIVERDGFVFDDATSIPDDVVTMLADNRVVVLGETHHLREHWRFVATVMSALHEHGFRQLLVERPQMNDWLIDDYVLGGELAPGWNAPPYFDRRFTAIRELNATLPVGERIHVRSIDANEDHAGGAADFVLLFDMLVDALPTAAGVDLDLDPAYATATPGEQHAAVEELADELSNHRSSLVEAWDSRRLEQVAEMVEVEAISIDIRQERAEDDNGAARSRETLIKELVDRRVGEQRGGTVVNIGAHHAQKSHLMGTEQEWLGDHLTHESAATEGSVVVVGFSAARVELEPGAGGTAFDVTESSPESELLRVVAQTWPGRTVFLPLDDPVFATRTVAYNSEDVIYATTLFEQFDALLQYGVAHRMPID